MNADAFRQLYAYHFSENRRIWQEHVAQLSDEQFTRPLDYSLGSIRNQLLHVANVDDAWFAELRGVKPGEFFAPAGADGRAALRAYWDEVERGMRLYLAELRDEMLLDQPISDPPEDKLLRVWQVLLQVVNHGTDHRAQILRGLHDFGVKTTSQDFIFYVYDHP